MWFICVVNVMECIKDSDTLSCYEPFTFHIYIYENNRWFNHGLDLIVNLVCFVLIHEEMGF